MNHIGGTRPFVEVIYVLGNDRYLVFFFQFHQGPVPGVGLNAQRLFPALVIKILHQCRVTLPGFGGGYVFDAMVFP